MAKFSLEFVKVMAILAVMLFVLLILLTLSFCNSFIKTLRVANNIQHFVEAQGPEDRLQIPGNIDIYL